MKIEVKVPAIGESIAEVTLGNWIKKDGDHVEEDEILCEVESEKATVEVTAEQAGILYVKANEGDTLPIGAVIAEIDTAGRKQPASKPESETKVSAEEQPERMAEPVKESAGDEARITPVAANILQEAGIRADGLKGTGTGGRITKADALDLVKQATVSAESADQKPAKAASLPSVPLPAASGRSVKRVRMSTLRKTISERLLAAKHGTAMLTTMNEIDLTRIKEIRGQYKDAFKEKYGVSLGFMSFFTKACCEALTEFPVVNAMIDGDEIVYHDFCDISIAVSTPKGLVVPVIRDAERMTLAQIEQQIGRIADKARENKLTIEEMTGGTFSITNGGVFGSLLSTPIINAPQSAILGMHTIQDRPVVRNGEIVIRPMMYVSLSYDHRIIDGKESVSFLVRVKELLEDPVRLLIGV